MPYIIPERRPELDKLSEAALVHIQAIGELNYFLTITLLNYAKRKGIKSYETHNEVIGVLECTKMEFYRRSTGPLEDQKKELNGEVF